MKKQIIFIHGGMAFSRYPAFLEYLHTTPIEDPFERESAPVKKWKYGLKEALNETHEILYPRMPNAQNAKYLEWKLWFERYLTFVSDGVILIGHSQGGYFLARYLSEEKPAIKIRALYLVAAPCFTDSFGGEDGGDFAPALEKISRIAETAASVYIIHSIDDPLVPYTHAEKYMELLPLAQHMLFSDRGHFNLEEFPEIIASISAL